MVWCVAYNSSYSQSRKLHKNVYRLVRFGETVSSMAIAITSPASSDPEVINRGNYQLDYPSSVGSEGGRISGCLNDLPSNSYNYQHECAARDVVSS